MFAFWEVSTLDRRRWDGFGDLFERRIGVGELLLEHAVAID